MKKKIISLCLVIALVATAIAGATLAYFTDYTDVATNTFTVGNVDIELDEAKVNPETGKAPSHDDRVMKNEYKDIYPGLTVDKDPTVTVKKGSEPCYVRMFVKVDPATLEKAFPKTDEDFKAYWSEEGYFLLEKLVAGWNASEWKPVNELDMKGGSYEFRYTKIVEENNEKDTVLPDLFKTITFPVELTNDQVAALQNFIVEVYAQAIQSEGFDDVDTAWAAFKAEAQQTAPTELSDRF